MKNEPIEDFKTPNRKLNFLLTKMRDIQFELIHSQSCNYTNLIAPGDATRIKYYMASLSKYAELFCSPDREQDHELENKYLRKRVLKLETQLGMRVK